MIGRGFLWEAMPLAWELTNPMSVLFSITECRKTWNPIIRRPDAQGGTESRQDVITNQFFIENNQDNQELDPMTRMLVQERDRERLRKMTFYCYTRECLRDYILRYFGEYGSNYCGNCQNCLTQFETVEVTAEARALAGCVSACRQRYGINVILDTVHGANTAKIRQYHMEENPFYGSLSKVPMPRLRQIMNHLLLQEYLTVTNDAYALVQLTEKSEILFETLRGLRAEIAREEKVPPYIVFSDKTLVFMSRIKPKNREEMLQVTGVGEYKLERYGLRFFGNDQENHVLTGQFP